MNALNYVLRNWLKMSSYRSKPLLFLLFIGLAIAQVPQTQTQPTVVAVSPAPDTGSGVITPQRKERIKVSELLLLPHKVTLQGIATRKKIEFSIRQDEIATEAALELTFTASPSLIPDQSQLKVYLNNELAGVISITDVILGKESTVTIPFNPVYLKEFNQFELEFIGSYRTICVNAANPALWIDINKEKSILAIKTERLKLQNDLANFPAPFFEANDRRALAIPFVLPKDPGIKIQKAAGILASWFGVKAAWRPQAYSVSFDTLPLENSIVFATKESWPAFLGITREITGPTIELIDHPDNPFYKVLLVLGQNEDELLIASQGIVQGNTVFRGPKVVIDKVIQLAPRQLYDAPNWVRTDRPMFFSELQEYEGQLESVGLKPDPIRLNLHLPPDLFLVRKTGVNVDLKYRYSIPTLQDQSRLDVRLNQHFIKNFLLENNKKDHKILNSIPIIDQIVTNQGEDQIYVNIPELKLKSVNQLTFEFTFASIVGSTAKDLCQSQLPVDNFGAISGQSTIDFTGYRHYIEMPDLQVFAEGGFPFSRMADLAETTILIGDKPSAAQIGLLFNTLGMISAHTGYPATNFTLTHDWGGLESPSKNNDLLIIGRLPEVLQEDAAVATLIEEIQGFVKAPSANHRIFSPRIDRKAAALDSQVTLTAHGAVAAMLGLKSPFNSQRSVVALLANDDTGYELMQAAFNDAPKRLLMQGSAVIIRNSGLHSLRIGDTYFVGHIPWWEMIWHTLTGHPVLLALLSVFAALISALLLWRILRSLSYRRLSGQ